MAFHEKPHKEIEIRAVTFVYPPFVTTLHAELTHEGNCLTGINCINITTQNIIYCCSGMAIQLFDVIASDINLPYKLYLMKPGSWEELVNYISAGKAEIGVQMMYATISRQKQVDYTHKVVPDIFPKLIIIRTQPLRYVVINWTFLYAMEQQLIIYVPLITIAVLVVVFLLENIGYKLNYNIGYNARESFSYINGILYQRDLGAVTPHRWPARVVSLVFALAMTVLISAYTAQLTASNIAVEHTLDFKGLKDDKVGIVYYLYVCVCVSPKLIDLKGNIPCINIVVYRNRMTMPL